MNPWPIYESCKKHWRRTRTFLTEQEARWQNPDATDEEIIEGMIEFSIAYENTFRHERIDFDDMDRPIRKPTAEMVKENRRIRRELLRRISLNGSDGA